MSENRLGLFLSGEENYKVIRNPRADPDDHQKPITSIESTLVRACQVWSTSVSAFVTYTVYRMTENDHITSALLAEVIIIIIIIICYKLRPSDRVKIDRRNISKIQNV